MTPRTPRYAAGWIAACLIATLAPAPSAPADFATYDYGEPDEGITKSIRLAIPAGLPVVRGILIHTNAAGGDTRERYRVPYLRAFAALHGFAFLGAQGFNSHPGSVTVLEHGLARFAAESGHPELLNVPFAAYGFSAGAGFANRLTIMRPERVIGDAPLSSTMRTQGEPAVLATPVCMISGEQEQRLNPQLQDVMTNYRPRGARFSWAVVEGLGHREQDQMALAILFLDHCIRMRYPADADPCKGPVALRPVEEASGWVADHSTWRSGLTAIAPYASVAGNGQASWLPDKDTAFVYRAYATYGNPLKLTYPRPEAPLILGRGASLQVTVDDSAFTGWRRLELYSGAAKLGEITQGPARFAITGLAVGVHALHVLGTDAAGAMRASRPALVIVMPGPAR